MRLRCGVAIIGLCAALAACMGGGADIGQPCTASGQCRSSLQCLQGVCTPRCQAHSECGDGYTCEAGECSQVVSAVGDPCERELDCGPGQACRLDLGDEDGDGFLAASCQPDQLGAPTGAECVGDADCHNGTCALGRCTEVCAIDDDCPDDLACVAIPRLLPDDAPMFRGCLQRRGRLELSIPVNITHQAIRVPVPGNARSFALVARIDDPAQLVGASRVVSPGGRTLYATPHSPEEFYQNPLRYAPSPEISTLMVPNTPTIDVDPGAYAIEVGSFTRAGGNGNAVPDVTVIYKLGDAVGLDVNFYFLNLEDHPCLTLPDGVDAAAWAQDSAQFQSAYLQGGLEEILGDAGINVRAASYTSITDRSDLDGLTRAKLPRLLRVSDTPGGINVFFVRSIHPAGVQALVGGSPGPPGIPGTPASGIAVATETLCYRSWADLARLTAHQIGRHLGLFHNREPGGALDPIPDSGDSSNNLMFYSEFGGTELSPGQSEVLRAYPGLR